MGSEMCIRDSRRAIMSAAGDTRRVCRIRLPALPALLKTNRRALGVYSAGALFAAGWWFFFDACIRSSLERRAPSNPDEPPLMPPEMAMHAGDWFPGVCTTLGLLIVNLVDKQHLLDEGGGLGGAAAGSWGNDPVLWRTRLWLFIGFAFLAGGMAGSVALLVIKYMLPPHAAGYEEFGVANVIQNMGIMVSAVLLWISQRVESDYEYNLTL